MSLIQGFLKNGYSAGAWTGTATATTGAIRSASAAANPLNASIGFADSADVGNPANLPANTIELRYTVIGDTNLDGTVGLTDLAALLKSYNTGTMWDQGDVTYEATTGLNDLAALLKHYSNTAPSPAAVPRSTPAALPVAATSAQSPSSNAPTISVTQTVDDLKPRKLSKPKRSSHR